MSTTTVARDALALKALVTRFVVDNEHNDEVLYIQGVGYSEDEVRALVAAWVEHTSPEDRREVVSFGEYLPPPEAPHPNDHLAFTVVDVEWVD